MELPIEQNKGIVLKEYGRNLQKLVDYTLKVEDRAVRSRYAKTLIELMKQINPNMRDAQDYYHKLWDHLYIMSNFQLDVDTPFPMPEKAILGKKPMRVDYNLHQLRFKHYGRNVELLIAKAIELTDEEERYAAILYIGKLMKRFYATWNKENVEDEVIVEHLHLMSRNKLQIDIAKVKASNLFDSREPNKNFGSPGGNGNVGGSNYNSGGNVNGNNNNSSNNNNNSYANRKKNNNNNNNKDKRKRNNNN